MAFPGPSSHRDAVAGSCGARLAGSHPTALNVLLLGGCVPEQGISTWGREEGSAWAWALLAPCGGRGGRCSQGDSWRVGGSELGHGEVLEQLPPWQGLNRALTPARPCQEPWSPQPNCCRARAGCGADWALSWGQGDPQQGSWPSHPCLYWISLLSPTHPPQSGLL